MLSLEQITALLDDVLVPGIGRSVTNLNLVLDINIKENDVVINLASAALDEVAMQWIHKKAGEAIKKLDSNCKVVISFIEKKPSELNKISNVIAVMSGKGGVGKSLVTALTAIMLNRQGYSVGILDADITGPSIPKMFGIKSRPGGSESGILPVQSANGIELISINLFLPEEDEAVIWRGPMIGRAITQFWEDVLWGNLDYLVVDLPPGTADAPLTTLQVLPVNGAIIVFTPQDLSTMIVKKAVKMADKLDKKIIGVVENMSYLYVPEIKKKFEVFGKSRASEMEKATGSPLLARFPIDPNLAALCDKGHIERYESPELKAYGEKLSGILPANKK